MMEAKREQKPIEQTARAGAVAVLALLLARYLLPLAARHAPMALQRAISYSTFRAATEILLVIAVLALAKVALADYREGLGLRWPTRSTVIGVVLAAPVVSIVATYAGLAIAMPVLLDELAHRGAGASRANAGAFGAELTGSSIVSAVLAGALLAAAAEELVFRGALYGFLERAFAFLRPNEKDAEVPSGLVRPSPIRAALTAYGPAVVSAAVFGAMHADVPGGVGIVRVVSTTCLGLATGIVRRRTASIVASATLHATYNLLALATARGALGALGTFWGAPVVLLVVAGGVTVLAIGYALNIVRSRGSRNQDDAPEHGA